MSHRWVCCLVENYLHLLFWFCCLRFCLRAMKMSRSTLKWLNFWEAVFTVRSLEDSCTLWSNSLRTPKFPFHHTVLFLVTTFTTFSWVVYHFNLHALTQTHCVNKWDATETAHKSHAEPSFYFGRLLFGFKSPAAFSGLKLSEICWWANEGWPAVLRTGIYILCYFERNKKSCLCFLAEVEMRKRLLLSTLNMKLQLV